MNILHLADLHIGKKVNGFSMLDEQENVLNQAIELVKDEKIDTVMIAGDVFDRDIAPNSALNLFSKFLNDLNDLNTNVLIIPGNHDNSDRLSYLSSVLKKHNIYFAKPFEGEIEKITIDDINFYLLPYLHIFQIKKYFNDVLDYNDGFKRIIENIKADKNKTNILLAHQFVVGINEPMLTDSEAKNVGGLDNISYEILKDFTYVALGHLHCPQKAGLEYIRYAGSILKYSFSEINQKKRFTILKTTTNNKIEIKFKDIQYKREFQKFRGFIDEFLDEKFYSKINKDDYMMFTLLDESVIDAKKKLSLIYPNIMILEFDNAFTRNMDNVSGFKIAKDKSIFEHFSDFYSFQMGREISNDEAEIVSDIISTINESRTL